MSQNESQVKNSGDPRKGKRNSETVSWKCEGNFQEQINAWIEDNPDYKEDASKRRDNCHLKHPTRKTIFVKKSSKKIVRGLHSHG